MKNISLMGGFWAVALGFFWALAMSRYMKAEAQLQPVPVTHNPTVAAQSAMPEKLPESFVAISETLALLAEKKTQNPDVVGWLAIPDTALNDVVVQRPGDNDYYLRRNLEKRYANSGVFYADKDSKMGPLAADLGKNTVIYGHSMSDSKDDVRFGPMRYYLEEDFARTHPYIHFSTTGEERRWEVVAVFYTAIDVPYNRGDLSEAEFAVVFDTVTSKALYNHNYTYRPEDKFLTLSTCVYSLPQAGPLPYPNDYRLGIMARLVPEDEPIKTAAELAVNQHMTAI